MLILPQSGVFSSVKPLCVCTVRASRRVQFFYFVLEILFYGDYVRKALLLPVCCLLFPSCSCTCTSLVLVNHFLRWASWSTPCTCRWLLYSLLLYFTPGKYWIARIALDSWVTYSRPDEVYCTGTGSFWSFTFTLIARIVFFFFSRLNFSLVQRVANFFYRFRSQSRYYHCRHSGS